MQESAIKRKNTTKIRLKNSRTHTCHSSIVFEETKLNTVYQFVRKDDASGGYFDPDGRISLEGMFKWIFKFDTGTTVEEGIEQPLANAGFNVSDKIIEHSALYKFEKVLLTELTPAGDIYRIGLGVDPYTGITLTPTERLGEAGQSSLFFGMKKLFAFKNLLQAEIATELIETSYDLYQAGQKID